MRSFNFKMV